MEIPTLEQTPKLVFELDRKFDAFLKNCTGLLNSPNEEVEKPVDIATICDFLDIAKDTAYKYVQDPDSGFPFHKQRGRLYFFKSEVSAWIKSGKSKSSADINEEVDQILSR